jgi:opacity protein-like surface antigen
MRFGVSFTTGSRIRISDEYNAEMELSLDDGRRNITTFAEPFQYTYRFGYPYRATAGVAFLISGRGAVSIEADFLDYRTMSFSSSDYSYDRENETIEKSFGTAINVRGGIEWLLTDEIAVRGGYAYFGPQRNADGRKYYADMTQPQNLTSLPMQRQFFSLGAGYKAGSFFVDIAYLLGLYAQKYLPYSLRDPAYAPAPVVVIRNQTHFIVTTLGFRFGGS